jgi:hypothetical protein
MHCKTPGWTCHAAADYGASPEEKREVLNYAYNTAEDTPTYLELMRPINCSLIGSYMLIRSSLTLQAAAVSASTSSTGALSVR